MFHVKHWRGGVAVLSSVVFIAALAWCLLNRPAKPPPPPAPVCKWERITFADLPGWESEAFDESFRAACRRGRLDWCDGPDPKAYIEENYEPQRYAASDAKNLFTGYYSARLPGSLAKTERFRYPLLKIPSDLVVADIGAFFPDCRECKGLRLIGRVSGRRVIPYAARREIDSSPRPDDEVLAWLESPIDAFILHVQGSGIVDLPDGTEMPVGFAESNGRKFAGIGRALQKGEGLADISMPAIRRWLEANPKKAAQYLHLNERYIFFAPVAPESFPRGAQGLALTPGRSIAVDPAEMRLGEMLWLETEGPEALRRLVFAQDTGAAIKGPQRGDFYWGLGPEAFERAGIMKSQGRYYWLKPKSGADAD